MYQKKYKDPQNHADEAKDKARVMEVKLEKVFRVILYFIIFGIIFGVIGYITYLNKYPNTTKSSSTIYTQPVALTPQERCTSNGNEWDYSNWQCVVKYSLHIQTNPSDARVQIMNIKPKYYDGIKLKSGRYDIRVSRRGYYTENFYIDFDSSGSYSSNLIRK